MGRLHWVIKVSPKCNHKCSYKMEAQGDLTEKNKRLVTTEAKLE